MPTFLRLVTDVLSPHYDKIIKYSGDHPSKVFKIIPTLIKLTFRITSTKFYEDDVRWDRSTDIIDFYGQWRGKDEKDGRTSIWIKVRVMGKQRTKDKKGNVTIYLEPYMVTKLRYSNFFDKALARMYSYFFYGNQRRKYISRELTYIKQFEDELKKELGIA